MHMNAANIKQVRDAERREKDEARLEANDLIWIMEQPQGRRFINRLLDFCGYQKVPFDQSGSMAYFKMGSQNLALRVVEQLKETCFPLWIKMQQEQKDREVNNV